MDDVPLPLSGVVVVEMASFVAGPSAGMALADLGADVIRIDPLGGAADINRWPVDEANRSFYWSSLNRGKRSVQIDTRSDAGRDVVTRLICAPGPARGIFIDNAVGQDWASWPALSQVRPDLIHVHVEGHRDGRPAVDYTVNAEVGVPLITGPAGSGQPVNHVLPAWDLIAGMGVVNAVLAALLRRERSGVGAQINIALADIAFAGVANLGWLTEARRASTERTAQGNSVYGSYGEQFQTADGKHVMVVALTSKQWLSLVKVTDTVGPVQAIERANAVDFAADEAARYEQREPLAATFAPWFAQRDLATVAAALDSARVLWSPYRTLREASHDLEGPLRLLEQPGLGEVVSAQSPIRWADFSAEVVAASRLGADTFSTLTELAGVSATEFEALRHDGVVIDPAADD
jgi:2-methylfumaryl-CoA isomerase